MKPCLRFLLSASILAGLTACSSAPVHFYTLVPPLTHTAPAGTAAPFSIAVLPVTIPAQVDQPQMVVRQGQGQVALLEGEQWIAPLGDEIRSAISSKLTQRLDTQDVQGLASVPDAPVYQVKVDVSRFDSVPGQYTQLVATWSIRAAEEKGKVMQCASHIREPVGVGYAALAEGHQRGLQTLADGMATTIQSMAHGQSPACP